MPLAPIPQNQIDALPLRTAEDAAAPDSVVVEGNVMTKYWGPSKLGVSAITMQADPDDAAGAMLLSDYIDARGCSCWLLLWAITATAAGGDTGGVAYAYHVQARVGTPPIQPRTGTKGNTYATQINTRTPIAAGAPYPNTRILNMPWSNQVVASGVSPMIGTDTRLWGRTSVGANGLQLHSWYLWGQGG